MEGITNSAVLSFFKQELDNNQESYLAKRIIRYRLAGKRRWFMAARQKNAYVWQQGRFDGDVEFWQQGLSKRDEIKPVKSGQCLRLFLYTSEDFAFFRDAAIKKLQNREWLKVPDEEMTGLEELA